MKFEIIVKMKSGTTSKKVHAFSTDDPILVHSLFDLKDKILTELKEEKNQNIEISSVVLPGFIITIDENTLLEDANEALSCYFKEISKKVINDEKSSIYNMYNMYTPPYPFINMPNVHGLYNPPTSPLAIIPYPFQTIPANPAYPNVSYDEKVAMQPKQDPDRVKKEMDDMESSKTIGDEYVERMKSAFDDFMGSILEIYKNYKEEKEKELEDEELEED